MKKIVSFLLVAFLIYFIALSFYLRTKPVEQNQDLGEILSLHRPHLNNIKNILTQKALYDNWNRYYDPAYYLEYFEQYNSILNKLHKINPKIFSVLPKRPLPKPSKTTDFEGRGYLVKSDLMKLSEDIDLAMDLIDNNYQHELPIAGNVKFVIYEQWWFQFFVAPFLVGLVLIGFEKATAEKKK